MENQNQTFHSIPGDILDDLASRFIINVPEEERKDIVRICFQIELAHWFYLDFYCNKENNNRKCSIKEFVYNMFKHIPFLNKYCKSVEETYDMWRTYKLSVPTFGAIILDQDMSHILLVQGFYSKCSWGFPKGKINEGEESARCAVREVLEETSFDISPYMNEQEYLEHTFNDQLSRLYIIPGVPRDTGFMPATRCEIKSIQWFPVDQLPCTKKDTTPKDKLGLGANSFFMIIPFMRRIRLWIEGKKAAANAKPQVNGRKQRLTSQGESDTKANNRKSAQKEHNDTKPKQNGAAHGQPQQNGAVHGHLQQQNGIAHVQQQQNGIAHVQQQQNGIAHVQQQQNGIANGQQQQNGRASRKSNGKRLSPRSSPPSNKTKPPTNVASNTAKCPLKFDKHGTAIITAPSWTNFHFDRRALIQQLAS